ncbi:MAG: pyruvate:ferredoxin (flavodoxin) oxidoreductase [Elusimicrobiota bacterium]
MENHIISKAIKEALDGNEAAARVAYALSEVIAIYPITPASPMGEWADAWSASGKANLWGVVPTVAELQSEGGAVGTIHGALSAGSLAVTFTSSQGLLLMIPAMFKIAGELSPFVLHVAARSVATHALSIFGDHSDVMACRTTGFAMLASNSVQEAQDMAAVAHMATLTSRIPFLHFFDGFRTSHEIQKIDLLSEAELRSLFPEEAARAMRGRGLSPERPVLRGSAQNPDVFFQAREAVSPFYRDCPALVRAAMDRFASLTGRRYRLFEYDGDPAAERVVVLMGSGVGAAQEAVDELNKRGEKVGMVAVRLYRPFSAEELIKRLPPTTRVVGVLDRTKEPGSLAEPLHLDLLAALRGAQGPLAAARIVGGRYGLSSKEFTPAMAAGVFAELKKRDSKDRFTVGIRDDVSHSSLEQDASFSTESPGTRRAVFFGLGADGTVSANKNSIKIIAEETPLYAQGYFVYDSKKSGSMTVSHLRFGPEPIRSTYLISTADFVACHQEVFLDKMDMLSLAAEKATFLLNTTRPERAWDILPREVQEALLAKKMRFFAIDALGVAKEAGLGGRINTVMQACFFHITGVLPGWAEKVKEAARKTYGAKSEELVLKNAKAIDGSVARLREVPLGKADSKRAMKPAVATGAPEFVRMVLGEILAGKGDALPVSAMPVDGTFPTATAKWEKRCIADEIPVWDSRWCIQCNKCALVCPHTAIRVKAYPRAALAGAPSSFKDMDWKGREFGDGTAYTVQVAPEDCTGCGLCVEVCPAKNKTETRLKAINMTPLSEELKTAERAGFEFFLGLPEADRRLVARASVKGSQLLEPRFEFSGACAGCGETPYLKLLSQLFGDRLLVANATGCSSIYGGNLPTTPWSTGKDGRGPAWSNSLFENNAEFGLGLRLSADKQTEHALMLLGRLAPTLGQDLVQAVLSASQEDEAGIAAQRERVAQVKGKLEGNASPDARDLGRLADSLVRRSVWIVGGDGWAYDIGYGGLDHVLRSTARVRLLVLDTEVYSNTGGQASKATPRGAVAKFASAGKNTARKDLALQAAGYGNAYVARIAMGADDTQTVKSFVEAESFPGPAILVAYSHCIAHGFDLKLGMQQQKLAVDTGYWPLFRYDPRLNAQGKNAFQLDSKPPRLPFKDYAYRETRYRMLSASHPEHAKDLLRQAEQDILDRWTLIDRLSATAAKGGEPTAPPQTPAVK